MRLDLLITLTCVCVGVLAKTTKKSQKQLEGKPPKKTPPAIIAIEIIDPKENATGKGRKRTIESSLGYGYQNFFSVQQHPPKYEVYKYSQQDIPGLKGGQRKTYQQQQVPAQNYQIQKSLQYDLGSTVPQFVPNKNNYQHGTTLFSTLDQHGHIAGLSSHVPHNGAMVPVIILRVYTNQLNQPGALHANIPQSHPYSSLNSVNLQNLLQGYTTKQNYYQQQEVLPASPQYDTGLQTHENYPDDSHTKVIFHKESEKTKTAPQKFKITIPANTYSKVEVQDHSYEAPQQQQQQYYYPEQYYQPTQQYQDAKQYVQVATYPNYQYQEATQQQQQYIPQYESNKYDENQYDVNQYETNQQQVKYQPPQYKYKQNYEPQQYELQQQQYEQPQQQYEQPQQQYEQPQQQYEQPEQRYEQPQQQYEQPQQQYEQPQQYVQQYEQPQYEQQAQPQYEEQAQHHQAGSQNYEQQKAAAEVGRDLHPKIYNYHAVAAQQNQQQEHPQKQRSTKKRKNRRPLVLAPAVDADNKDKQ